MWDGRCSVCQCHVNANTCEWLWHDLQNDEWSSQNVVQWCPFNPAKFSNVTEAENLLTFGNLRTILHLGSTLGKALGPISLHTSQQYGIRALETIKKLDIELHKSLPCNDTKCEFFKTKLFKRLKNQSVKKIASSCVRCFDSVSGVRIILVAHVELF